MSEQLENVSVEGGTTPVGRHQARRVVTAVVTAAVLGAGALAGIMATAGEAAAARPTAVAAYPRGYVADANLRAAPTTASATLAHITDQYVEIVCYTSGENTNGTAKWFRAQYYSSVGYLNANVVTDQPAVGAC